MERILLVEDDSAIYQPLTSFLRGEGFAVRQASGQREALALLETEEFDLVLLDVGLRDGNGFSVCSAVKQRGGTAVIFLSASGDEYSVVTGLDLGADDYIAKPFRPRELVSRIRSVLRRTGRVQSVLDVGLLRVDTERACVSKNGQELSLSALEYRLLLVFLNHRGATLSRAQLLEEIWDVAGDFVNDNTLTVYIKRLRDKLEDDPQDPALIRTVRVSEIPALYKDGVITGGMIPKVECCAEAVRRGVPKVFIIDGRVPHSIIVEMLTDEGLGTMFIK